MIKCPRNPDLFIVTLEFGRCQSLHSPPAFYVLRYVLSRAAGVPHSDKLQSSHAIHKITSLTQVHLDWDMKSVAIVWYGIVTDNVPIQAPP